MNGRRALMLAFLLALAAGAGFVAHAVWTVLAVAHGPAPVESWMTPGLIETTYGIGRFELAALLNLDPGALEAGTLAEIAAAQGIPVERLVDRLQREVSSLGAGG